MIQVISPGISPVLCCFVIATLTIQVPVLVLIQILYGEGSRASITGRIVSAVVNIRRELPIRVVVRIAGRVIHVSHQGTSVSLCHSWRIRSRVVSSQSPVRSKGSGVQRGAELSIPFLSQKQVPETSRASPAPTLVEWQGRANMPNSMACLMMIEQFPLVGFMVPPNVVGVIGNLPRIQIVRVSVLDGID
jgi:hypothetical protein